MNSSSAIRLRSEGMSISQLDNDLATARRKGPPRRFPLAGTVRCVGQAVFRSALARDLAMLLDLDDEVEAWQCRPAPIDMANADGVVAPHVPDFLVTYADGSSVHLDAGSLDLRPVAPAIAWSCVCEGEIRIEPALSNARDMLRYSRRIVPLGDRICLLAYLDDAGAVTLVEAASAMRESSEPIGAIVALALQRIVRIEWRDTRICPETRVEAVR